jgi:hypothetical protein
LRGVRWGGDNTPRFALHRSHTQDELTSAGAEDAYDVEEAEDA